MFRLRIWGHTFREVDTIEHPVPSVLLEMGKTLQKAFGAYYRLEVVK